MQSETFYGSRIKDDESNDLFPLAVEVISNRLPNKALRLSTADQVISSLSNLVFIILVAQSTSSGVFAQISTIWTVVSFSVVISRSVFGVPLLLDQSITSEVDHLSVQGARSGALLLGAPAAIGSFGFFVFTQGNSGFSFLMLAACIPFILLQDFGRYIAIASDGSKDALVADLALFAPLALASIFSATNWVLVDANLAVGILFLGLVLSMLTLRKYKALSISLRSFRALVSSDIARRIKLLQEALLYAFTAITSVAAVWLAYDSNAVAAFNGTLYLLAPISFAAIVVTLVLQQSISKANGIFYIKDYSFLISLLTAAILWTLVVSNIPRSTGIAILGVTWDLVQPLIVPMAAVLCLSLILEFVLVVFRACAQFSTIVKVREIIFVLTPLIYVVLGMNGYSLATALYAVAIVFMTTVVSLYLRSKPYFLNQLKKLR